MPLMGGVYTGVTWAVYAGTQAGAISCDDYINNVIMQQPTGADSIVSIYMCPTFCAGSYDAPVSVEKTVNKPTTIANFQPKNNKLLTFPYSYLVVDSLNESQVFRYEWFTSASNCVFNCIGTGYGNPTVICVPKNYETSGVNNGYTHQVVMGGYPQCAFTVDTYKQWLAQNGVYNEIAVYGGVASAIVGTALGSPAMVGAGIYNSAKGVLADRIEANRGNRARGAVANSVNAANRSKDIYFKRMGLNYEKAKSIDEFFTRYGYACERVKVPNINARVGWTYTKTKGCVVKGKLPASSAKKIAEIFDHGITFWKSAVGNYSNSNVPNP